MSNFGLDSISGISARRLIALAEAGIRTPADLLHLKPNRYLDRSTVRLPSQAQHGDTASFAGTIHSVRDIRQGKRSRLECLLTDGRGLITGVWFNSANWVKKQLVPGTKAVFFGTVKRFGSSLSIAHPDFLALEASTDLEHFTKVIPVYPNPAPFQKAGIYQSLLTRWILEALERIPIHEFLPAKLIEEEVLLDRSTAYRQLHFPDTITMALKARERLAFEELFLFQCTMFKLKQTRREKQPGPVFSRMSPLTSRFFNQHLPFTLTEGQKLALSEIKQDVRTGYQMNRLIQGDVGAGKTIVALGALLMALDNGYQAAFMAPTELLAEQHFKTLERLLSPLSVNVRLLIGNQSASLRTDLLTAIEGGQCQILVGTHALIQENVRFHALGMIVVDEQHRFGVAQRQSLGEKGLNPHILVMSATPIPRSLALTAYGNMDISAVKGLPAGRKPVTTRVLRETDRAALIHHLKSRLQLGEQAFVVFPLVEESEVLDLKSATFGRDQYQKLLPGFSVGLLHGKMKKDERDDVMVRFLNKEFQVLVATTVIEVGIDIPNATTMVIENSERFGLAQLHQLRGRVGRGGHQAYCFLTTGKAISETGRQRLRLMEETNDGFRIAEADLMIRGPGDFLGTKQSGIPDFNFANIVDDAMLLHKSKEWSDRIFAQDPELAAPEHRLLNQRIQRFLHEKAGFLASL